MSITLLLEIYIDSTIMWITAYFTGLNLLGKNYSRKISKVIFSIIILSGLLTILNVISFGSFHGVIKVISVYLLQCLFYKFIFKKKISTTFLLALIFYLSIFLSEVIIALPLSLMLASIKEPVGFLKNSIVINLIISSFGYMMIRFSKILLTNFIIKDENNNQLSIFIIMTTLLTIALLLFRIPVEQWRPNNEFLATMLILLGFCIIAVYLLKQRLDIQNTSSMYQQVVKYSNTTNKLLEDYKMVSHEHKNQLSIIRQMILNNTNEAIEYIDNLIEKRNDIKYKWVADLSKIPSAGLKGLINYKLLEIEDSKINVTVIISPEVSKMRLSQLSTKQQDNLYSIVGVYLDNAIQAAVESKKKVVNLEIYKEKKDIVFMISNTYKGKINVDKIDNYKYSTKGKNRGVGLHLVKTILEEEEIFSQQRKIMDNYYVQELIIHTDKIKRKK